MSDQALVPSAHSTVVISGEGQTAPTTVRPSPPCCKAAAGTGPRGAVRAHVPVTVIEARARDITRLVNGVVARPTHVREGAS